MGRFARLAMLVGMASASAYRVRADEWPSPQVGEAFSESRDHFIRVIPGRSWGDMIGFKGSPKGPYATAEFYARQADRSYRLTRTVTLLNPVAPVEFFVSDDGRLATIDNWHNRGYGGVVAIYDERGTLVKSYALDDLFAAAEIEALPRSVSSIDWAKGAAYIREDQKTLVVDTFGVARGAGFLFGLESGRYQFCETRGGQYRCRNTAKGDWKTAVDAAVDR